MKIYHKNVPFWCYSPDLQVHYTYIVWLPETGEYYCGVRSCYGNPYDDPYRGSMVSWKVDKSKLQKTVIAAWYTREAAEQDEIKLITYHINNPLNRNAHIPGVGFHRNGLENSVEHRLKIMRANNGRKVDEEGRENMANARLGMTYNVKPKEEKPVLTPFPEPEYKETKSRQWSPIPKGSKLKPEHTYAIRKAFKTREKKYYYNNGEKMKMFPLNRQPEGWVKGSLPTCTGKVWYTNGETSVMCNPEDKPEGWVRGRKLKKK